MRREGTSLSFFRVVLDVIRLKMGIDKSIYLWYNIYTKDIGEKQ